MSTDQKVPIALEMERAATTMDPRVGKTESVRYGDAVGGAAIASTEGVRVEYRATGCWVVVVTLAEQDGDTQTGFSYRIARTVEELDHEGVVAEAVERAARMLGATKPATARVPVLLDPVRRVVVPRRPVGRVVGRVRAEAALAVRPARGRTGRGRRAHARRRRTVARRARRGAVRRRGVCRPGGPSSCRPACCRGSSTTPTRRCAAARVRPATRCGAIALARRRHHEPVPSSPAIARSNSSCERRRAACSCRT